MALFLFGFEENRILWLVVDEVGFPAEGVNLADCYVIFRSDDLIDGINSIGICKGYIILN